MPLQWVMSNNLTHLRELHLLDKEYFKVLLNAVVCSSTHLSHKMRRTGAPSPAQPETSTGKSQSNWVGAFCVPPRLQILFCCRRHLQLPSVHPAAGRQHRPISQLMLQQLADCPCRAKCIWTCRLSRQREPPWDASKLRIPAIRQQQPP